MLGRGVFMAKFCTNCGNALEGDKKFCPNCGNQVGGSVKNENVQTTNQNGASKSKIAAGLLGIFLGCFGVHNFYLGFTGKAVGQLLLTVLSCGALSFVSGVWGLIEGIMILTGSITTDATGSKLQD